MMTPVRIPRIDTPITAGDQRIPQQMVNTIWFRFFEQLVRPSVLISTTTGAQTLNAASGRFNVSAGTTSVVITNEFVSSQSIVLANFATNDATGRVTAVVPAAGSFTVFYVAPTALASIAFTVAA